MGLDPDFLSMEILRELQFRSRILVRREPIAGSRLAPSTARDSPSSASHGYYLVLLPSHARRSEFVGREYEALLYPANI